ncbi:MAG: DUF3239 domain-containing protein [Sphingobacteriales bacterium]|jgi:hypothetical protein|nr:DUF3239 domain-containing protein [Sphingobacteriales bacterium]
MKNENIYTVDSNTFATNPGNVNLKPFVWIKYNLSTTLILTVCFVLSIWLTVSISLWFFIIILLVIAINLFYWRRKNEHFRYGDSNGGIIVSNNPMLVAVTTDLTKGFGDYPVIKIIKYKGKGKVGDKIGTVALYSASVDDSLKHWIDFEPIPIIYATDNIAEIERAIKSYDEEQWKQIESRLLQIPKPYMEGLYKIKGETSDWKE